MPLWCSFLLTPQGYCSDWKDFIVGVILKARRHFICVRRIIVNLAQVSWKGRPFLGKAREGGSCGTCSSFRIAVSPNLKIRSPEEEGD